MKTSSLVPKRGRHTVHPCIFHPMRKIWSPFLPVPLHQLSLLPKWSSRKHTRRCPCHASPFHSPSNDLASPNQALSQSVLLSLGPGLPQPLPLSTVPKPSIAMCFLPHKPVSIRKAGPYFMAHRVPETQEKLGWLGECYLGEWMDEWMKWDTYIYRIYPGFEKVLKAINIIR